MQTVFEYILETYFYVRLIVELGIYPNLVEIFASRRNLWQQSKCLLSSFHGLQLASFLAVTIQTQAIQKSAKKVVHKKGREICTNPSTEF